MANPEHLALLKGEVEKWNHWRKDSYVRPDLSNADLHGANLKDANLSDSNLSGANLKDADLHGANLKDANLSNADLSSTYLRGLNLSDANLRDANLSDANLSDANLYNAKLSEANLSGANLSYANLSHANLSYANLSHANLYCTNLSHADLWKANFHKANLKEANLSYASLWFATLSNANVSGADLHDANLHDANLSNADLSNVNLWSASLWDANLSGADLTNANLNNTYLRDVKLDEQTRIDHKWKLVCKILSLAFSRNSDFSVSSFSGTDLSNADLHDADLKDADLSGANLKNVNLKDADLSGANLKNANLKNVNLTDANLSGATLSSADLNGVNFMRTQALGSDFSAATLTGACIEDWNINSSTNLQNVVCQFIFKGCDAENSKFTDRRPHDPNTFFKPGEFAALMQQSLETVDLIFIDGIDWKAFFASFQQLQSKYRDDHLSIQAIEKKPDGAFVIRLEVDTQADRAAIELDGKSFYETQLQVLEAQYEERLRLQGAHLEDARRLIEAERQEKATLYGVMETMAENQGPKYDQRGSNFGNFVDTAQAGSRIQSIQHNYASEKPSLAEAAAEIQKLLKQLEQTNPDATEAEQKAFVTAVTPPTLRQRAVGALQSGGEAALEELPYGRVVKAIIEGWQESGNSDKG